MEDMEEKAGPFEALLSYPDSPVCVMQYDDTKPEFFKKKNSHVPSQFSYVFVGILALSLLANIGLVLLGAHTISELHALRGDHHEICQSQTKLYCMLSTVTKNFEYCLISH